jgi:hypothetical protein
MDSFYGNFKRCLGAGIKKGWDGFLWMLKIIIPVSFLTFLIEYSGWIGKVDFILAPALNLLGLPPMAAMPLIAGMLSGTAGGIASMVMLPFTKAEMTLIAVFLLIAHNFIQEGIIQGKTGLHPLKAAGSRIVAAALALILIAPLLSGEATAISGFPVDAVSKQPIGAVLKTWALKTFYLSAKIFVIIMVLMMLLETLKGFNVIPHVIEVIKPLLKIFGLDDQVAMLWLTAIFFGIAYGAAVIIEEAKEKSIAPAALTRLQLSIGINHSMIDDPALYLAVGVHPIWLWVPRLMMAILVVQIYNLAVKLKVIRPKC